MIFSRPSLTSLCLLLAWLAGATVGRAEAAHATAHSSPPTDPAAPRAPAHGAPDTHLTPDLPAVTSAAALEAAAAAGLANLTRSGETADQLTASLPSQYPEGRAEIAGLHALGASLTERGDFEAAEIAFRQIMGSPRATGEDLSQALIGLARVFRKQGSFTKAAAIYERFIKDYPSDGQVPDALLELGRTHRALGAHQLALSRFYSVINSTLKLSAEGFAHYQMLAKTAQFEIAETHFQQGEFTEANKFFSRLRLLDLAPADRARAHFKSAYALYLAKDFAPAVSVLNDYLTQWPQDENVPEARYLLSLSYRTLGLKEQALKTTLELLRGEQNIGDPKRYAYWQRRTGNQLANEFFQNGDTHNALIIYQGLAILSPEPSWRLPITYQIGLCYERMRITDRAEAAYRSIIDQVGQPAAGNPAEPARPASAELTELARMAAWRISQLNWQDQTERQLTGIFNPKPEPAKPAPLTRDAPNIDRNATTTTFVNDHPGNSATAPASL